MPSGDDSHPCTNGAAIGLGTNAFDLQPVVFRATIIAKERRRLVHINDGDVHVAVVVEVPEGGPTAAVRLSYSQRSEEHTSELQSHVNLVCRLLLEKKKIIMVAK